MGIAISGSFASNMWPMILIYAFLGAILTAAGASLAVTLFCYQARKFLGALAGVLGGVDTLVFTGGSGENSAIIRARICANLAFLGIYLDVDLNKKNGPIISRKTSPVTVRVMKTNEELMIARHTRDLIGES